MPWRDEWNALADEDRHDVDVELIDLAGIKKRGDQLSATHHPDLFSRRRAQTLRERLYRLRDELHTGRRSSGRVSRKHIVGEFRVEHPPLLTLCLVIVE